MLGSLISLGVEGVLALLFLPTDRQTITHVWRRLAALRIIRLETSCL